MSYWDSIQQFGAGVIETADSWGLLEGNSETPATAEQQAVSEQLADGSVLPQVPYTANNTGEAISQTGYVTGGINQTLMIGGVISLVAVVVVLLFLRGAK